MAGIVRNSPGRNEAPRNQAVMAKVLLCAMVLGTMLASAAAGQVLEATIPLPDSLGPLAGKNHVAFDEDSLHPRIFIGGEGGDVMVADAITCERFARIPTGPMNALCYVSRHNRLYVSTTGEFGVLVVDCSSYSVTKRLPFRHLVTAFCYDPAVDRVYCATAQMSVIDCASDSIVDMLGFNGTGAGFALDSMHNKLYVGAKDALRVIDCDSDSMVASIDRIRQARCVYCATSAGRVYAAVDESLFVLSTATDSVLYKYTVSDAFNPRLAGDPEHGRVYYSFGDDRWYWGGLFALDCTSGEVIWRKHLYNWPSALAPVPAQDKVYMMYNGAKFVFDGATGQSLRYFGDCGDSEDSLYYCAAAKRVFAGKQGLALTALDDRADTTVGFVLLGMKVDRLVVDSVDNKLFFSAQLPCQLPSCMATIGSVDCYTNQVRSYARVLERVTQLEYDSRDDKLYCAGDSNIFVLDCKTDTVIRSIPMDWDISELAWNPVVNRLYVVTGDGLDSNYLAVVDCARDSVTKTLNLGGGWWISDMFVDTALNELWMVQGRYIVIDCLHDSMIADTNPAINYIDASYDPATHRIYDALRFGVYVIDMNTRLPVDSVRYPFRDSNLLSSRLVHCAPQARKVYWAFTSLFSIYRDTVLAIDASNDSAISSFGVPFSDDAFDDRTGNYVYFASAYDYLLAVDARTDQVVSGVNLAVGPHSCVPNRKTNRFYIAGFDPDDAIQVFYDSIIFAEVRAEPNSAIPRASLQTVFRRDMPLHSPADAVLFDASGRKVAVLEVGLNNVSHLVPGVYFVGEGLGSISQGPGRIRKVIVTR